MPGRARRIVSAPAERCHFLCSCKESNQRNTPPGREPSLRAGTLRFSANQGTAPNSLRSNTGASSPLIPLRCSARSRRTGRSRSTATASTHGVDLLGAAVAFDLGSDLSEPSTAGPARAKRCGCLSAASSRAVPRRTEERRVPMRSIGSRLAERFFGYFLDGAHPCAPPYGPATPFWAAPATRCTSKETDTPPRSRKRISVRANENGTFAGAVSMNRVYAQIRTSRRTPPRNRC